MGASAVIEHTQACNMCRGLWCVYKQNMNLYNCTVNNFNKSDQQGSIHTMLQSISSALCTVNGELCSDDQSLVTGEKQGKSSHSNSKSTQTFKIDVFTEEVYNTMQSNNSQLCAL